MSSTPNRITSYVLLGGSQLAVGAAAIFARYALDGAGPLAVSASRLAIAAAVLVAFAATKRLFSKALPVRMTSRERVLLIVAGVALAVHFAAWIWSLQYVTVAVSTLLVASTPAWTALYDALFLRRPLTRLALVAFVTGGLGLITLVGFDRTAPPHPGHETLGVVLALTGALAIAVYFILIRAVRQSNAVLDTRRIVTQTYTWAALALILASLGTHQAPPSLADIPAWLGIVAMAVISQLLGHTALNASLRSFTPNAVAFTTLLEPVFAAILALVIFHEGVSPLAVAGALILLASIGIVLREESMEPAPLL